MNTPPLVFLQSIVNLPLPKGASNDVSLINNTEINSWRFIRKGNDLVVQACPLNQTKVILYEETFVSFYRSLERKINEKLLNLVQRLIEIGNVLHDSAYENIVVSQYQDTDYNSATEYDHFPKKNRKDPDDVICLDAPISKKTAQSNVELQIGKKDKKTLVFKKVNELLNEEKNHTKWLHILWQNVVSSLYKSDNSSDFKIEEISKKIFDKSKQNTSLKNLSKKEVFDKLMEKKLPDEAAPWVKKLTEFFTDTKPKSIFFNA